MDINLNACREVIQEIDDSISNVKGSFESDWDDNVHDSFGNYISEAESRLSEIKTAAEEMISVGEELASVNMDELMESAEALFNAIDAICGGSNGDSSR